MTTPRTTPRVHRGAYLINEKLGDGTRLQASFPLESDIPDAPTRDAFGRVIAAIGTKRDAVRAFVAADSAVKLAKVERDEAAAEAAIAGVKPPKALKQAHRAAVEAHEDAQIERDAQERALLHHWAVFEGTVEGRRVPLEDAAIEQLAKAVNTAAAALSRAQAAHTDAQTGAGLLGMFERFDGQGGARLVPTMHDTGRGSNLLSQATDALQIAVGQLNLELEAHRRRLAAARAATEAVAEPDLERERVAEVKRRRAERQGVTGE